MSDIHGCYDEFQQMLNKIQFSKEDLLICAGDYIDRGSKNYEMMSWIVNAPENVIFVRGNHDEEFLANIDLMNMVSDKVGLEKDNIEDSRTLYKAVQKLAKENKNTFFDYYGTVGMLINEKLVPFSELCKWAEKVKEMPYYFTTEVGGRICIVVHAGYIENLEDADTEDTYSSLEELRSSTCK